MSETFGEWLTQHKLVFGLLITFTVMFSGWLYLQLRRQIRINWRRSYTVKWYWLLLALFLFALCIVLLLVYLVYQYLRRVVNVDTKDMCLVREVPPLVISKDVNFSEFNVPIAQTLCMLSLGVTSWSVCSKRFEPPKVPGFELIATIKVLNLYSQTFQDNCAAYYSKEQDCLIICFAGTTTFDQVLGNVDFRTSNPIFLHEKAPKVKVQTNYWKMYNSIRPKLMQMLEFTLGPQTKILLTGHSLGGSFAAICFIDLIAHNIAKGRRTLYTFGSPRAGNKYYAQMISADNASFRVTNSEDVIPSLPFPVMGDSHYTHIGQAIDFSLNLNNLVYNHTVAYAEYFKPLERVFSKALESTIKK